MAVSTYMTFWKIQNLGDGQNIFENSEELAEEEGIVDNEKRATSIRTWF